jgi:hypothetical protein
MLAHAIDSALHMNRHLSIIGRITGPAFAESRTFGAFVYSLVEIGFHVGQSTFRPAPQGRC